MLFLGFREGPRAMGTIAVLIVRGAVAVLENRKGLTSPTRLLNETAAITGACKVERAIVSARNYKIL
jgi:hypothetical protein